MTFEWEDLLALALFIAIFWIGYAMSEHFGDIPLAVSVVLALTVAVSFVKLVRGIYGLD